MQTATQLKAPSTTTSAQAKVRQPVPGAPTVNSHEAPVADTQPERESRLGHSLRAISVFPPDPLIQMKQSNGAGNRFSSFHAPSTSHALKIQQGRPASIQRMGETISISAGSNSPSAYALRATGTPELYWRFIYPGGTVYRRTNTDPLEILENGWSRNGYSDLVRHTDTDQGVGSNWVATTENLTGMDERYGAYAFEIEIKWHQGVVVNPAYQTLTGHRNPHAEQNEVAVWGAIPGAQVTAVWVPKSAATIKPTQEGPAWANSYERFTRSEYVLARQNGSVAHPPVR